MTEYGDNQEPGIITELKSSAAVPTFGPSPSNVGFVGQADLSNAESPADTSKVYQITRASEAVERFGPKESSLLTQAVIDALSEGSYPIYAVATPSTSVTAEDHSGIGETTFTLNNAPIRENADSITVSLDGTNQNVRVVYDDVSSYSPTEGTCYINPVYGELELPAIPNSTLEVGYDHFDYMSGVDTLADKAGDIVDFFTPLSENGAVVDYTQSKVNSMQDQYNLALAVGGADIYIDMDTFSYEQPYDDSRTQVLYPTRFRDGTSALAAYVGFKAQLGLSTTPINKRLDTNKRLIESLDRGERNVLSNERVVVLADEVAGVRVTDDPTTVSATNTDEQNLNYGFNRLAADYIIDTTRRNQQPFIGKLNSQTVRNVLEGMVSEQLTELQESDVVISYKVNIQKENAVTAGLEMSVNLVEPLRFIDNTLTIENDG